MESLGIEDVRQRISQIMDRLSYFNDLSGNIFDNTLIDDNEIELAKKTPFYEVYRNYKIKLIAEFELLVEKIAPTQAMSKNMDLWFFIASEYAFLGSFPEKVKLYSEKLDWELWNPAMNGDATIYIIFRELQARVIMLNPKFLKTPN